MHGYQPRSRSSQKQVKVKLPSKGLTRIHYLGSPWAGCAHFFALTPSPSPTLWERGVGAYGGAFPLARPAGEGDTGGEGKKARLPIHAYAGKIAPASAILCRSDVPLSALKEQVFSRTVGMAGGTPAFPASRVLGARASRSHGGKNALLGNAASRHARKKPTPLRWGLGGSVGSCLF